MNPIVNEINYPYIDVSYGGKAYRFVYYLNDDLGGMQRLADEIFTNHLYVNGKCQINAGDLVLDGGAHIGMFTIFALINGAKPVIAVEPNSAIFPILEYNVKNNFGNGNVVLINKALWNCTRKRPNRLRFSHHSKHSGSSRIGQKRGNNRWVEGITIDAIGKEFGKIDFIKLDVETSERQALVGAKETIKHNSPNLAICLYHHGDDIVKIPDIVRDFNAGYGEPFITREEVFKKGLWEKPN